MARLQQSDTIKVVSIFLFANRKAFSCYCGVISIQVKNPQKTIQSG